MGSLSQGVNFAEWGMTVLGTYSRVFLLGSPVAGSLDSPGAPEVILVLARQPSSTTSSMSSATRSWQ